MPDSRRTQEARSRRSWAGTVLKAVPLLRATFVAPAGAQVPADRPVGARDASAPGLAPFAGRRVATIDITGHNVTKDWVITREIRTKVGDPLDVEAVGRDVARLDNLSIFAEIRVDGEPVGDDAVRLVFTFKEMPSWFPILSYVYTEENGFSWGAGLPAGNLTGRDLSVSARVYFGDLEQQWSRISWPWIRGNHVSFDFYGARYTRPDELRGFEETSYEFTPEVGTWIGDHGWARAKVRKTDVFARWLDNLRDIQARARVQRVEGLSPSAAAAPFDPLMRQPALSSARRISSRAESASVCGGGNGPYGKDYAGDVGQRDG